MIAEKNKYTVIIVVLSVLLAILLVAGSTFAWFASNQTASRTITLGDPVRITLIDREGENLAGQNSFPITIAGNNILPGMRIDMLARARLDQSTTPAILRARVSVVVRDVLTATQEEQDEVDRINQLLFNVVNGVGTHTGVVDQSGPYKWAFYQGSGDTAGWWYYLGSNITNLENAEQSVLARVDSTSADPADRLVTFIDNSFIFPRVDNLFANSNVEFRVTVQALQGYLPPIAGEDSQNEIIGDIVRRINTINNVRELFNSAFGS